MGLQDREYYKEGYVNEFRLETMSVVVRLIVINVAVFVIDLLVGHGDFAKLLAVDVNTIYEPWMWWKYLTYGFAHGGPEHIAFNMIALYFFGREMEYFLGKKELLTFYLVAIIFCGVTWNVLALYNPPSALPPELLESMPAELIEQMKIQSMLGASGGVMAIIIAFCVRFPLAPIIRFPFTVPAWVVGLFYVVGDLSGYMAPSYLGHATAYEAHLAGAVFAVAHWYFQWRLSDLFGFSWLSNLKRRMRRMKSGLRIHRPANGRDSDQSALEDEILAKVHEQGIGSLTPKEKMILEEYSRRLRSRSE